MLLRVEDEPSVTIAPGRTVVSILDDDGEFLWLFLSVADPEGFPWFLFELV